MTTALIVFAVILAVAIIFFIFLGIRSRRARKGGKEGKESRRRQKTIDEGRDRAGETGEDEVAAIIGTTVEGKQYVFRDIIFDVKQGRHGAGTTEIDDILVNRSGIFVIEAKNWNGVTYADPKKREWVQTRFDGTAVTHRNPFMQNETHVRALRRFINDYVPIYSYVVFVRGNVMGPGAKKILTPEMLGREIKNKKKILSASAAGRVSRLIENHRSRTTKTEHINNVHETYGGDIS